MERQTLDRFPISIRPGPNRFWRIGFRFRARTRIDTISKRLYCDFIH